MAQSTDNGTFARIKEKVGKIMANPLFVGIAVQVCNHPEYNALSRAIHEDLFDMSLNGVGKRNAKSSDSWHLVVAYMMTFNSELGTSNVNWDETRRHFVTLAKDIRRAFPWRDPLDFRAGEGRALKLIRAFLFPKKTISKKKKVHVR